MGVPTRAITMHTKAHKPAPPRTAPVPPFARTAQRDWEEGLVHAKAGDWAKAEHAFHRASERNPCDTVYLLNLARAQMKNGAHEKALQSAQSALALKPDDALARMIVADCLSAQHRYQEAANCLQQQPDQTPRSAEYYQNLGEALFNAGQHQAAIAALFEALSRNVDHALSHYRLGLSFNALGMKQEATECFRTALVLGLGHGDLAAQGLLAFVERELCRWQNAQADVAALQRLAAALPDDAASWASVFAQVEAFAPVAPRPLPARLRVGFVSADFHQHATAILMAEVFEKLDRSRFDITLYSHGPDDNSPMRARLRAAADRFVDVARRSDLEVAQQVRHDEVDLLVDLKGHTRDARLAIFGHRAAPVQLSFLGFPGTTGATPADGIDYFVGDAIVSPLAHAAHFSEKLALMPGCYQPNDRQRPLPGPYSRVQAGLPEGALVLCGFNQPFKLSPEVFDVWCRLLDRIPNSVLWLLQWNDHAPAQLRAEAAARGIDPQRLVFAPKIGLREHLSRLALADLFIDTWPCNGHTTASDALWAGVPVVSYAGQTFASRVAASLLDAVGLPQLACTTVADYEARIVELAGDAPARQALRQHLVAARDTAPLFDSETWTRDFGRLLWAAAERWSQGLPPDHIVLAAQETQGATA
jgi:predicted O-linked N-acetylglucosamine transferase (SPINDLY family)